MKWKKAKDIADDHILIIGQVPTDETVNGFGFGDHFKKLSMIVDYLKDENLIVKLHPSTRMKIKGKVKRHSENYITKLPETVINYVKIGWQDAYSLV